MNVLSSQNHPQATRTDYVFVRTVKTTIRLLWVLTICVAVAVMSGVVRFGTPQPRPSLWIDGIFLISCAGALACVLVLLIHKLVPLSGRPLDDQADDRGDGQADR